MLNKILSIGRNVRDLKQGESSMDPNCLVEKLSVSLQSYETTEVDSSNRLVAPGTLKPDSKIAHRSLCLELTSLMVARRKRSCFRRRARFSRWGSLHISNLSEHRRPKEISGREGGQRNKNQRSPSPVRPKEERPASTSRIRLKVTLGKELVHSRMIDIKPVTGSGGKHCWGTRVESPKITKDIEDRFDEETMLPSDKEIVEKVDEKIADGIDGKPAQKELPILEVAADNGCLDSETSPDSEVINLIPEDQISQKVPEVLYDISTTAGNASVNTSSSDTITMEPLPSSGVTDFRISTETLKVGSEGDLCCELGVHSELAIPEKFLPNNTKPKGHKSSKSSRSTTNGSDAPQSISSKGNSCKQKGNQSKRKVKEKRDDVNFIFREDNFSETGEKTFADIGVSNPDVSPLDMVPNGVQDQSVPQRNAWVSCDNCGKWRRIPVALADSIDETESRWICKDNVDKKFADCSILQEMSNAEINAELDISDASAEEDAGDPLPNSTKLGQKKSTAPQQPSWKLIKSNLFLHRTRKSQTIDEIMVCHCKAPQGGRMGCRGDECLNRMLNIECVKGTCPCGEFCSNQQFQKRKYAKLECFRSGKKGHGLKLLEDIRKGQFLIEYVGEVLDMNAYEGRQREYALRGHKHFYFMTLNGSEVIDACAKGNLGRFINHSCEPNCRTEKWMVNGEVCIGLFALRDIGKGEEVTFDYNYVRVFGAAAKKCVCGSTLCGGYIGGDPLNAEVVVQVDSDEEYPEPVMVCEDDDADFGGNMVIAATGSLDVTKTETAEKDDMGRPAAADEHLEVTKEMHALESLSKERLPKMESSIEMDGSVGLLPSMQTIMAPGDGKSEITLQAQPDASVTKETTIRFLNTSQRSENSSLTTALSKSSFDTTTEIMRKSKYGSKDRPVTSTVGPIVKTSNSSSPVKKGKPRKSDVNVSKSSEIGDKPQQPYKLNKIPEGSSNDPFEAVQVKLNELLNADGGISKRKDASRGYLKLLFLTAASGDRGNGEAIQSNRDLSMILDALLKTKSRTVLGDIINKNGLQMLHNIVKRYRKEFHKIPILRKLLKVLEYLAVREILTLEHITSGPHCAGVESFRESILSLTEHKDRQVHQIARNFRDKWIPWHIRKNNYMDRDVGRKDFNRAPSKCNNMLPASNSQSSDVGERSPEKPINRITQSVSATTPVSSGCLESCSASCSSNGTNIRKRKSRWDQPAGSPPHKEPRFIQNSHLSPRLDTKNVEEDAPPGFSHLNKPLVSSSQENGIRSDYPVTGHPQERFVSRFPVSFGIPLPILQQFGMPQGENTENWAIAAGIPFQPYPPLPTYPRCRWSQWGQTPAASPVATSHHTGQNTNTPNASGTDPLNTEVCGSVNQQNFQQRRSSSNISERKFPRQSRWDSNNTNSPPPPWVRSRLDRGNMGNNPRTGANLPRGPYNLEQVNIGGGSCGNTFYHHPYHQN